LSVTCAGRWFSLGTPVSSANKIDRHDIAEILVKVALNTIKQTAHVAQPITHVLTFNIGKMDLCRCVSMASNILTGLNY